MTAARVTAVTGLGALAIAAAAGILYIAQPAAIAQAIPPEQVTPASCDGFTSVHDAEVINEAFALTLAEGDVVCIVNEVAGARSIYAVNGSTPTTRLFGVSSATDDLALIGLSPLS